MFATSILNLPCLKASSVPTFFHPVCKQTLYPSSISVLKILSASALKWHTMITCPVGLSLEPTISSTSNFLSSLDNSVSHIYFVLNLVSKKRACAGLVLK